jgi:hypothetical protein
MPQAAKMPASKLRDLSVAIKVGDKFRFYVAALPLTELVSRFMFSDSLVEVPTKLDIWGHGSSSCSFTAPVRIPVLANDKGDAWMSLTPNEVLTQRKLLKAAKGDVGMAGMGMGWLARRVLEKPSVTSLTVYDVDPHVLAFFGKPLEALAAELNKPLRLVLANAYEVDWTKHSCSLWDIWLRGDDGSDDSKFWTICRKLREQKISCHGWRTVNPSQLCEARIQRETKGAECCT